MARPGTIFIGTANRFARGVAHVWRYVLTTVGPERIYVCMEPPSTTHAADWMRWWTEGCGMWPMKGGLFQMRRASTSWRSVLQSFALRPRFGRLECTSGRQMMCQAGPVTPKSGKRHSGKHLASWLTHAMRCSCGCVLTCMASWDSTARGWRGCLMHVMYICIHRLFCIFGLNCFVFGGAV